jgi:ABC-type amino acid transport substrate-binding protein
MDTRTPPWVFVPGLDFSREDQLATPRVGSAQLGLLRGLDVDVMKLLARRLAVTPQVVPTAWPSLEKDLMANRFDVILCGWTPNPRSPAGIVASDAYCTWGLLIAARTGDVGIQRYADLAGRKVGHFNDPAVLRSLSALGHANFEARDDPGELFDELRSGALDAVVFDSLYVRWRVANDSAFRVVGEPLNRLGYHAGLRKTDAALVKKVQVIVRELAGSAEMEEIRRRWEGP